MTLANFLDFLQWPAMLVTVVAVWLVGFQRKTERKYGFWSFLASNVLWVAWGLHAGAHALVVLQFALAALNIRGIIKNEPSP
jgi:hypothetical protein